MKNYELTENPRLDAIKQAAAKMAFSDAEAYLHNVTPHGDRQTYLVKSRSRPAAIIHRVELNRYHGNGACSCEKFEHSMKWKLERNHPPAYWLQCHHIEQAMKVHCMVMIRYEFHLARLLRKELPDAR